jgi:tetratricopeptide (TPR) repeat protein
LYGQEVDEVKELLHELALTQDDSDRIEILNKIARKYIYIDKALAKQYADEALNYAVRIEDKLQEAKALDNLGHVYYYHEEDLALAFEYYLKSLSTRESIMDERGIAISYNNIGNIHNLQMDFLAAEKYYKMNLSLSRKFKDENILRSYSNLSSIYIKLKDYENAMIYLDSSILYNSPLDQHKISLDYIRKANIFRDLNQYDSSIYWLQESNRLKRSFSDDNGVLYVTNLLAQAFVFMESYDSAMVYVNRAVELEAKNPSLYQKSYIYNTLSTIYENTGQYKDALHYSNKFIAVQDSVLTTESVNRVAETAFQYELDKERKISELAAQEQRLKTGILTLLLSLIVVIILFLFYWQRSKAKKYILQQDNLALQKAKLESELEFQHKEITSNFLRLAERNEVILDVVQKLKKSSVQFKKENQKLIQNIIHDLEHDLPSDFWKQFENSFLKIHKNFYTQLEAKHPKLTPNEKRLCAFLKLNLNTKEIASILHLPISSVETARVRLRRKLELANTKISLVEYLSNF